MKQNSISRILIFLISLLSIVLASVLLIEHLQTRQPIFFTLQECPLPCLYSIELGETSDAELIELLNLHVPKRQASTPSTRSIDNKIGVFFSERSSLTRSVQVWQYDNVVEHIKFGVKTPVTRLRFSHLVNEIGIPDRYYIIRGTPNNSTYMWAHYQYDDFLIEVLAETNLPVYCASPDSTSFRILEINIISNHLRDTLGSSIVADPDWQLWNQPQATPPCTLRDRTPLRVLVTN